MKFRIDKDVLGEIIYVGDVHAKKDNIEESTRLIEFISKVGSDHPDATVVFGGDQYNDFGIARVEVVDFWHWAFKQIKNKTIALVGNHDSNPDMSLNFMEAHSDDVQVISRPTLIGKSLFLPFCRKNEDFLAAISNSKAEYLFCHQEFDGAQFENGFYSPGGFKVDDIPANFLQIISGHIHREMDLGRVWYPGTPRHLTRSDAGDEKGIYVFTLGSPAEKIMTPPEVCEPFRVIEINPETEKLDLSGMDSPKVFIDIKGPPAFVKKQLKRMPESAKVRTFADSVVVETAVRESEGIPQAFMSYAMEYANKNSVGNAEIKLVLDKIYAKCKMLKGV